MRFIYFLALLLGLGQTLSAGNFQFTAAVSKNHVELGERINLVINMQIQGNLAFAPQVETPKMDGFQVTGGPQRGGGSMTFNGMQIYQYQEVWELVALKSGTLSIGPFKAMAKDVTDGDLTRAFPAIPIVVAKGQGNVIPPTPTPEPDAATDELGDPDEIKPPAEDLPMSPTRIALLVLLALAIVGGIIGLALRKPKPKKIEVIRDPGQVALLELEKARQILLGGDEEGYYRELARVIRFYLRHRMRMPEKELTLLEAQQLLEHALMKSGEAPASAGKGALERLQELLFAGSAPQALDADQISPALRQTILTLEKDKTWNEEDLVKAELDRVAEVMGSGDPEACVTALRKTLKTYLSRREERVGKERLEVEMARALEEMGPAAIHRVGSVLLSRRVRDDFDLEKTNRDLQKLAELLEKGVNHGKRK